MAGRLEGGSELSTGHAEGTFFFHFEHDENGFVLHPEAFAGAVWYQDERPVLVVDLGAVKLWIAQEHRP